MTESEREDSILGLSTGDLAGLSVEELESNPTAITMLMHYYKKLVDDNKTLTNEANTLRTYVSAYETQRSNSATGAVLLSVSNISIAFGVNLLTSGSMWPGLASLLAGISIASGGVFFSFFKDK